MKLLNVHIDDFGKISNFDMDFTVNPAIISEENGWGKSTLATFIRVMFYGFDGEGKKKLSERERIKYKPWNKGTFGGRVIFEADGKEYELTRHFGDKEKDDSGSIIDLSTMLSSNDYSLDNIGVQLFGIDSESFVRTVFVGQGKTDVFEEGESIADGVAAKIGNLTDATDDVHNFEKVRSLLLSKSRELKSGHKQGIINELKSQKSELESNVNAGKGIRQSIHEFEKMLEDEENLLKGNKSRMDALEKEYLLSGKKAAHEIENKTFEDLLEARRKAEYELAECRKEIPGTMPKQDEIDMMYEKAREIERINTIQSGFDKGEAEEVIIEDVDEQQVDELLADLSRVREARGRIKEIEYEVTTKQQRAELVNEQKEYEYERKLKEEQEKFYKRMADAKKRINSKSNAFIISSVCMVVLAAVCFIMISLQFASVVIIAAIVLLVVGIIIRISGTGNIAIEGPANIEKPQYVDADYETDRLMKEKSRLQDDIILATEKLKKFFDKCKVDYNPETAQQKLYSIREALSRRVINESKLKEFRENNELLNKLQQELNEWFAQSGVNVESDYSSSIKNIERICIRHEQLESALKQAVKRQEEWTNSTQMINKADFHAVRDQEIIEAERQQVFEEIEESNKLIRNYVNQLDGLRENLDSITEDEQQLSLISDKIDESNHKYDIILETVKYMEMAKAGLTARYMTPVSDAFKKYYGYICEEESDLYTIDANINVTKKEYGERRSIANLSKGYRDLIDIALRMALLDAMYLEEKPFVVLDDPFVNLDTEKINKAKEFLNKIAKDYQVIYFTCHESRA